MQVVRLNEPQKELLIFVAALFCFAAIGYFVSLKGAWKEVRQQRSEAADAVVRNGLIEDLLKAKEALNAEEGKFLTEKLQYSALDRLTGFAKKHRLIVESMTPQKVRRDGPYGYLTIDFQGESNFQNLVRFLAEVARSEVPISVDKIMINRSSIFGKDKAPDLLRYQMQLTTILKMMEKP
ncbi:MAG: hypothetical protein ACOY3K_05710 [Candidatus Omnitrophota bacterium]